jgi:malonyl-CoA O-methyltransferase
LQWCSDIEKVVRNISHLSENCAVTIFCNKTFKTIYDMTTLKSFLPDFKGVVQIFQKYFDIQYEVENYKLYFPDNISKFRYMKRSGVSGGKRQLRYKETKELIENYPLDYLEFEVLYIKGAKSPLCD